MGKGGEGKGLAGREQSGWIEEDERKGMEPLGFPPLVPMKARLVCG